MTKKFLVRFFFHFLYVIKVAGHFIHYMVSGIIFMDTYGFFSKKATPGQTIIFMFFYCINLYLF